MTNNSREITALETYYGDNMAKIDEAFSVFCFYEGRFETNEDAKKHFNSDSAFWEFVSDYSGIEIE